MAKNFKELRAKMSPGSRAASDAEHRRLVEEMSLHQLRKARELTQTKIAEELHIGQGDVSKLASIPDIIAKVVSKVPDSQVMSDLDATVAWARRSGKANTGKLAITGFCWGGRIVWLYSAHNPKLKAGAAWYGRLAGQPNEMTPKNPIDVAAQLHAPILGLYGGKDQGIPLDSAEKMREALKAAGKTSSGIIVYPDAQHGFSADYRPSYGKRDAEDAWGKLLAHFKKHGV